MGANVPLSIFPRCFRCILYSFIIPGVDTGFSEGCSHGKGEGCAPSPAKAVAIATSPCTEYAS